MNGLIGIFSWKSLDMLEKLIQNLMKFFGFQIKQKIQAIVKFDFA